MLKSILSKARPRHRVSVEHERLRSLINSMADGVIAVDEHMKIVLSNGAAQNLLDINATLPGRQLGNVFKPCDRNGHAVDAEQLIQSNTKPSARRDLLLRYKDGSAINVYLSVAPVHLGYGQKGQHGFVALLRDITHEKSLEEERDEFISVVSHELRTPIAIAEGNISNAQFISERGADLDQIKQALKGAHDQILFLADMVNDLATLSRAERGKLQVDVGPIDVPALIKDLAANYTPDATARGLKLETKVGTFAAPLQSSKLYVREILQNFITNALKYTEQGVVTIEAEASAEGVAFRIRDTGIGISKSDQEKLFDKFFRSEDYRTRKTNGTGLGLYVTLKLARLLHADIEVQSELNHGSTFSVFIPNLALVAKSPQAKPKLRDS